MFICPQCSVQLARTKGPSGVFWRCPSCDGRSATVSLLRRRVPRDVVNALWQNARSGGHPRKRLCPACNARMAEVPTGGAQGTEYLDVCTHCQFVWFDPREYELLPALPETVGRQKPLPPEAKQALAVMQLDAIKEKARGSDWGQDAPAEWWKWVPAALGLPVEQEVDQPSGVPWITWSLGLLIAAVSLLAFSNLKGTIQAFGLVPAEWGRSGGLTFLTAFFLHGGIFHLLGNLYFLLVFGDDVEDFLGTWRFVLLLACSALAGDLLHIVGDPGSTIPCIGASGGISGIIAFYALRFPRARLGCMVRVSFWFRWIQMPAYAMFLIWVTMQCLGAWAQVAGFSNVSSLAHLGGAGVGFIAWLLTRGR